MTPAVVAAQRAGIPFTLHEYEHDPAASSYGMEARPRRRVSTRRASSSGSPMLAWRL
jgi:Cys-tRNA(Pro)/Cys-tRNA(Cys) deacylase